MRNKPAVFVVALAGSLWAQAPDVEKTASLEGVINHSITGEPLQQVHVTLRGMTNGTQRQYGAMTTPEGKFSIRGVAPGSYNVAAERVGFVMPPGSARGNQVRLQADEKKSDFKLQMVPTGEITGRVTDSDGSAVEGATVTAGIGNNNNWSGASDEKGQFRLGGLPPGKYRVKAAYNGRQIPPEIRTDGTADVHLAATYYPGVLTTKEASRVEVRPAGESSGVDIQLKRVPWVRVSGRVTGKTRASGQAFIQVQSGTQMGGIPGGPVRSDGTFVIWGLDPGKYLLSGVWTAPGGQYMRTAPVRIEVAGSNIDNPELRFIPDFEVAGQLGYENELAKQMPQPPQRAQANAPKMQRSVILREAENGMGQVQAQVADDETFRIGKVSPGQYRVTLSWNTAYVKGLQLGGTAIDGDVVDLSNGSGGASLGLTLAAASGSISGMVKDDAGSAPGTRVALTPDDVNARAGFRTRYSVARADNSYAFPNLPPGRYKVVAVSEKDTDLVTQQGGLEEYEDLMETVEVHADEKVSMDLKRRSAAM